MNENIRYNIFIVDYDDTILPSTFINTLGIDINTQFSIPLNIIHELAILSNLLIKFFDKMLEYGKIYIVTNANIPWVHITCSKFLPLLYYKIFNNPNIVIISAKTLYEYIFPNEPIQWKNYVIRNILIDNQCNNMNNLHLISFGDSIIEKIAVEDATIDFLNIAKIIKLVEEPSILNLIYQYTNILSTLDEIVNYNIGFCIHLNGL